MLWRLLWYGILNWFNNESRLSISQRVFKKAAVHFPEHPPLQPDEECDFAEPIYAGKD